MARTSIQKKKRCSWAETHELFVPYHDREWGVPVHNDRKLFEMLNLEGAQAGLSWLTILKKREGYRKAFDNFDVKKVARYSEAKRLMLVRNKDIVRNWLKINAVIENAKAFLSIQKEYGSFDSYIWSFTQKAVVPYAKRTYAMRVSKIMSRELKKRGFRFVGETICYAFMQAIGMVQDHEPRCFRTRML